LAFACIDVGSNTTRLLVAEPDRGALRELAAERVFTRLGTSLLAEGRILPDKVAETAEIVAEQARLARELGARAIEVVATAAIRQAGNREELVRAVAAKTGLPVRVLSDAEEARLSFAGATGTLGEAAQASIAVVDVGGGSTELAVGTCSDGVSWFRSFRIGSGVLADTYLRSDPPTVAEVDAVRRHVAAAFEGLEAPPARRAIAVGGSATSLRRLAGAVLDPEGLARCVRLLAATPIAEAARRLDLDPVRVRLLPAGILVLAEIAERLRLPLEIGRGGLREGVILELIADAARAAP
jgi:exopolyphosphatase/guanosine-5'-triphosphate,3'-diphosphate pyrophosphatase